jgi:type I restriction enzyme S subunit
MSEVLKIPKLRFPDFSDEWVNILYGDIYSFYSTNSFSRDNLNYEDGEIKNIHYGDIHTKFSTLFDITNELVPFINSDINISKIKEENYCKEGDLLIADASEDYSDIGKTVEVLNLNNEKLLSGLHTFLARPNKYKMAIGFSGYMLQNRNVRKQVMRIAQGTKVLGIATSRLGKVSLNIPSLPEQKKIATFLTAVDKKIALLQQKKALLEQYKKGAMQKIFSQVLRFKDDKGNDHPDWEEKRLGEISTITTGSSNRVDSSLDAKYTFFDRSQDIRKSSIYLFDGEAVIVAGEGQEFIPKHFIGKFDLHQRTYAIMNFSDSIGKFIYYLLDENRYYFYSQAVGSTVKSLRLPIFKKMRVILPDIEEQTKIADFLSAIDDKIELVNKQLNNTQLFKKGLLQQMFI